MLDKVVRHGIREIRHIFSGKPYYMNYPFSPVCNQKCVMCNFYKKEKHKAITPQELGKILSDPLFGDIESVSLSGGEPFMVRNIEDYVNILLKKMRRLNMISINTNASLPNRIKEKLPLLSALCRERGVRLNIVLSMDGVGESHNHSRGNRYAWDNFVKSLQVIKDNCIPINILMTIHKWNYDAVIEVKRYCLHQNINIYFGIAVGIDRLENQHILADFNLGDREKRYVWQFLMGLANDERYTFTQRIWYAALGEILISGKDRTSKCVANNSGVFLSDDGKLSYCAVYDKEIHNYHNGNLLANYKDRRNITAIKLEMIRSHCRNCMHNYQNVPNVNEIWGELLRKYKGRQFLDVLKGYQTRLLTRKRNIPRKTDAKDVLIFGCFGTETTGDKAIMDSIIEYFNNLDGDYSVTVLSSNPHYTECTLLELKCPEVKVVDYLQLFDTIVDYDIFVFGGGPIMDVLSVVNHSNIAVIADKLGRKVIVWGAGFGPFGDRIRSKVYRRAALKFIEKSDVVFFRDRESAEEVKRCLPSNEIRVIPDPAYIWATRKSEQIKPDIECRTNILGVSFRGWPKSGKYAELLAQHKDDFAKAIDHYIEKYDGHAVLIPMNSFYIGGDDRLILGDIYDKLKNKEKTKNMTGFYTPIETLTAFASSSHFIGMRFHSTAFATALTIPTIAVDYVLPEGKISSLFRELGMENYLLRLGLFASDNLILKVDALVGSSCETTEKLRDKKEEFIKAYEAFEHDLKRIV